MSATECHLCAQLAGDPDGDLLHGQLGRPSYIRRALDVTESFSLIPSLGALAPGHVLLCPRKHVRSLAALPGEFTAELGLAVARSLELVERVWSLPVHQFEHGNAARGVRVNCTVEHAHLHLVPADARIEEQLSSEAAWLTIDDGVGALQAATGGREYLFYSPPGGTSRVAFRASPFPSQLLRRVFAQRLGQPESWDWRDQPRPEEADLAFTALAAAAHHAATPGALADQALLAAVNDENVSPSLEPQSGAAR